MSEKIPVLDFGYVQLIESWGSDERVIESARMSVNKGFLGWGPKEDGSPGDERLLKFLYTKRHGTPFEMGGLTFEIQAPIFIFREIHRHRTFSYSELSARYTPLPDVNYIPSIARLMAASDQDNKQAGRAYGSAPLTESLAALFREKLIHSYETAQETYEWALRCGVPKELARVHLPVGRYSRMRMSGNLRNWMGFLALRMAEDAQWEVRQFANVIAEIVGQKFPRTYALFKESHQKP